MVQGIDTGANKLRGRYVRTHIAAFLVLVTKHIDGHSPTAIGSDPGAIVPEGVDEAGAIGNQKFVRFEQLSLERLSRPTSL